MYNEWFWLTNKWLQDDISYEVQMMQAKMNLYLSLLVYSLISVWNIIKYENVINNQ